MPLAPPGQGLCRGQSVSTSRPTATPGPTRNRHHAPDPSLDVPWPHGRAEARLCAGPHRRGRTHHRSHAGVGGHHLHRGATRRLGHRRPVVERSAAGASEPVNQSAMPGAATLLVRDAAKLLTMDAQRREIASGAVFVRSGVIETVSPAARCRARSTPIAAWTRHSRGRRARPRTRPSFPGCRACTRCGHADRRRRHRHPLPHRAWRDERGQR